MHFKPIFSYAWSYAIDPIRSDRLLISCARYFDCCSVVERIEKKKNIAYANSFTTAKETKPFMKTKKCILKAIWNSKNIKFGQFLWNFNRIWNKRQQLINLMIYEYFHKKQIQSNTLNYSLALCSNHSKWIFFFSRMLGDSIENSKQIWIEKEEANQKRKKNQNSNGEITITRSARWNWESLSQTQETIKLCWFIKIDNTTPFAYSIHGIFFSLL